MSYCFFFQAEDGIRDLVRSRGLGDVYKRQVVTHGTATILEIVPFVTDATSTEPPATAPKCTMPLVPACVRRAPVAGSTDVITSSQKSAYR